MHCHLLASHAIHEKSPAGQDGARKRALAVKAARPSGTRSLRTSELLGDNRSLDVPEAAYSLRI
jgi:hypothetical protein